MAFVRAGDLVLFEGKPWTVLQIDGPELLILREASTGQLKVAKPKDVSRPEHGEVGKRRAPDQVKPEAFVGAKKLKQQMDKLVELPTEQRREAVRRLAEVFELSERTIYRRLERHRKAPVVSSQLRKVRTDQGRSRRSEQEEKLIQKVLKEYLSQRTSGSVRALLPRMNKVLTEAGFKKISYGLLLARARQRPIPDRLAAQKSGSALREARRPKPGRFALADAGPLSLVQIDHSPLDIILVDEEERLPINRAFLTIVIDCYSRIVLGFYLSLDPVGALAAGMALYHAIMPKEKWLRARGLPEDVWPCYGMMRAIHTDSAKEFKGTALSAFCDEHGIDLLQRRKGLPSDGGIVESGFNTFMHQLAHTTPGTTFSNPKSKYDYDSEGNALLTISEAEQLFAVYITQRYHQLPHTGIGQLTPILRWKDGLLGTPDTAGIGLPEVPDNPLRLWVHLLPAESRTIGPHGVEWKYANYYSEEIRHRAHDMDPERPSRKRQHLFHYDPRDVSALWFIDPDTNEPIKIPCADATRKPVSMWQLTAAIKDVRVRGHASVDEKLVYDSIDRTDAITASATAKNKAARRERERALEWEKSRSRAPTSVLVQPADEGAVKQEVDADFGDLSDIMPKAKVLPWKR